jgi:CRP-like cAMP-binding protein
MHEASAQQSKNRFLAALPHSLYQRLLPHLEPVSLRHNEIIYEMGGAVEYVYFPFKSLISLVTQMKNGETIEVGLVGSDGVSGITALMGEETSPDRAIVQIANGGMRAKLSVIKEEFNRGEELSDLLLRYTRVHLKQVAQTAACNATHTVEERLARWLLMCRDRVGSDELKLTQEFISQMLGTRRATVSTAASALQVEKLIQYHHGHIRIIDRQGLEEFACECYQAVKEESDRLLGSTPRSS